MVIEEKCAVCNTLLNESNTGETIFTSGKFCISCASTIQGQVDKLDEKVNSEKDLEKICNRCGKKIDKGKEITSQLPGIENSVYLHLECFRNTMKGLSSQPKTNSTCILLFPLIISPILLLLSIL